MDDILVEMFRKPFYVLIILIGLFFSLKSLPVLTLYVPVISKFFFTAFVLILSILLARVLSFLISRWFKVHKRFEKTPKLISKVVSVVIYLIAFLMILGYFEIEITPLVATLGLGGLAVGLALQATLSNFFAGLHIISDNPISIGDFVELPDANISGYVDDIGWRSTRIRTLPDQIVIVPNSKLAESIIINDCLPRPEMAALVQVGVSYESDLNRVEKVTVDVARKIQKTISGAVKNFEPFIRYHTFGDSNINFTVILRVEQFVDKYLVTHEFIKALKEKYNEEGIEISWPVRKIYTAGSNYKK
ncbi:MAG: mechanosensitive ion channel [Candidatus Aenigmarchaeota archaeon]|nr:mechanosensitive ion channel [Candidatus Aenigmarchaeota archaeon]